MTKSKVGGDTSVKSKVGIRGDKMSLISQKNSEGGIDLASFEITEKQSFIREKDKYDEVLKEIERQSDGKSTSKLTLLSNKNDESNIEVKSPDGS